MRGDLHPLLAIELARRGRVWGEFNAETLRAIRTGMMPPSLHGGPKLSDRTIQRSSTCVTSYRRFAAPAP